MRVLACVYGCGCVFVCVSPSVANLLNTYPALENIEQPEAEPIEEFTQETREEKSMLCGKETRPYVFLPSCAR